MGNGLSCVCCGHASELHESNVFCFKNRGAVLGAISSSISQYPLVPELKQALMRDEQLHPYAKLRKGLVEYTQGLEPLRVPDKLEYDEAVAMFEIWNTDRALHSGKLFSSNLFGLKLCSLCTVQKRPMSYS